MVGRWMKGVDWTEERLDALLQAVEDGIPVHEINRHVGVGSDSCRTKIEEMGFSEQWAENRKNVRETRQSYQKTTEVWDRLRF